MRYGEGLRNARKAASARADWHRRAAGRRVPGTGAITGPILSIVPPCFGQTGMKVGAGRLEPGNPPAALRRVTLD